MFTRVRSTWKRSWRVWTATMVVGLSLWQGGTAWCAPSTKELADSYRFLDVAFNRIQKEALEERSTKELVNASLDGMILFVERKKLDASFIKHPPADYTDKQAKDYLRNMLVTVATKYPELYKDQRLTMEAVQGAMKSLDPYTVYLDPEAYKLLQDTMAGGNFGGIGVVVTTDKTSGFLTIVEPMEDSPASRAGLKAKDRIIKINDVVAKDITVQEASKLMRGEPNTTVDLTIQRGADQKTFVVTLTREKIHVASASGKLLEEQGHKIGYIELSLFGDGTNREVEGFLRDFDKQGAEGYILDVRNNAGGYVVAAIDVCSKFLPAGQRVTSINPRVGEENVRTSRPTGKRRTQPLVVLVNERSASASEITAGAMKDLERGTLVGVKTFGKGSVQNIFPVRFPDKQSSAFKITIAHYHTPLGHDINKMGITPDIEVKLPDEPVKGEKYDPQMQAAIDTLVKKIAEQPATTPQDAKASSSSNQLVAVNGLLEERAYIAKELQSEDFRIVECQVERKGDILSETVVAITAKGERHTFRFDISSVLQ